jgi:hypothetical protein
MADESSEIRPITASASGRENGFLHHCKVVEETMFYASCLGRLAVLQDATQRTPKDWTECARACQHGICPAQRMREEELLKGKAIYFSPRGILAKILDPGRTWIAGPTRRDVKEVESGPTSALTAIERMGRSSYAEVLTTSAAITPRPPKRVVVALPGETPLQMARRIAAENKREAL